MKIIVKGAVAAAALVISSTSFAQITYTNFGVGDTFNTGSGWTVGGPNQQNNRPAMQFTASTSGIVDTVRFASWYATGSTQLTVALRNDNADTLGSQKITWGFNKTDTSATITTLTNPFNSVTINAGTKYWLDMWTAGDGWHAWNLNDQSVTGLKAGSTDNGANWTYSPGSTLGAFEVTVKPVPEPTSMIILGGGLAALVARRRRKRV